MPYDSHRSPLSNAIPSITSYFPYNLQSAVQENFSSLQQNFGYNATPRSIDLFKGGGFTPTAFNFLANPENGGFTPSALQKLSDGLTPMNIFGNQSPSAMF